MCRLLISSENEPHADFKARLGAKLSAKESEQKLALRNAKQHIVDSLESNERIKLIETTFTEHNAIIEAQFTEEKLNELLSSSFDMEKCLAFDRRIRTTLADAVQALQIVRDWASFLFIFSRIT